MQMPLIETLQQADISSLPKAEQEVFADNIANITDTESQVEGVKALNWLKYAAEKYKHAGLRKILSDYERELASENNQGFNTVTEEDSMAIVKITPYKKAIKLPKAGAVAMDKYNIQASTAEIVAGKHALIPETVYNWANKHDIDLARYGYVMTDVKNNSALVSDILNDEFKETRKIVESSSPKNKNIDEARVQLKLKKVADLTKITSSSAIECVDGKLYIIGDDATHIMVADTDLKNQKYTKIFDGYRGRIPKMEKSDLEASAIINKGTPTEPERYLLMAGSGSLPNREVFIEAPLNDIPKFKTISATPFYTRLKAMGIKNLNIEGMSSISALSVVMASRGNRTNPAGYLIATTPDFYENQETATIVIIELEMPEATMSISGLCYMANRDILLFTASTENSSDAVSDGPIGNSYLGWFNNMSQRLTTKTIKPDVIFNLAENDNRFKNQKIEGICVEDKIDKSITNYIIHMVSDNDNGNSELFTASLNIPQAAATTDAGKIFYNSHGSPMTWKAFVALEIERGNNTRKKLKTLQNKYKIGNGDEVIWVTENPVVALSYEADAEARNYRDKLTLAQFEEKYDVDSDLLAKFTEEDGYLIPETDDGDEGFLMVFKAKQKKGGQLPLTAAEEIQLHARWEKKKDRIMQLGNILQKLKYNLTTDMKSDDEKTRLTALVIAIMNKTAERVGNEESGASGHHGVTGFKKKHIKIDGNTVELKYIGKSGVEHEKSFTDELIAKTLKKAIKDSPDDYVFVTSDGFKIQADRINRYLQEYKITAKDIRGYTANKFIVSQLEKQEIEPEEKKRIKQFRKAAKYAAQRVGHGVATLKKHYMIPELEEKFVHGGQILNLSDFFKNGGPVNKEEEGKDIAIYPILPEPKPLIVNDTQAALSFPAQKESPFAVIEKNETAFDGNQSKFLGEIGVYYNKHSNQERIVIRSSKDMADFLYKIWDKHTIELQESFYVLYLNRFNRIIAWHAPFRGGVTGTVADKRIVVATAAKVLASSVIIAHNHPSGNLQPSSADTSLTKQLREALLQIDIALMDSLIIVPGGNYYSFADAGILEKGGKVKLDMGGLFHGSPHDFDKFSTDNMGGGEGFQSEGWGLYLTDVHDIAEDYARKLADIKIGGIRLSKIDPHYEMDYLRNTITKIANAKSAAVKSRFINELKKSLDVYFEQNKKRIQQNEELLTSPELYEGQHTIPESNIRTLKYNAEKLAHVYEALQKRDFNIDRLIYRVTLHDDKLLWLEGDKLPSNEIMQRIKEQLKIENNYPQFDLGKGTPGRFKGEQLLKIFENKTLYYSGGLQGKNLYAELAAYLGGQKEASLLLLRAGIDGIKYPASKGQGHNYVVFDANTIFIDEKVKFRTGGSVRSFGEGKELSKELQDDELATMTQLFFANLHEADIFKVGKKTIVVIKVVPEQYMKLLIGGVAKKVDFKYGHFVGSWGKGHDWFDQIYRDVEGMLMVDLINRNNQFHEFSEFWKIAHRDSIYTGNEYADGGLLQTKEDVLKQCSVSGNVVKLPAMQLDRKLYMDTAKALELIGGKWNRKEQGFVFPSNPTELLEQIATGEKRNLKKEFQFFATPPDLADWLVKLAEIKPNEDIEEPSAGQGAIVQAIHRKLPDAVVYAYELMPVNMSILKKLPGVKILGEDFLNPPSAYADKKFDTIIANPPFSKNQDIDHVRKMYDSLKPGGRLVSVMSKHWQQSENRKETEFREWLNTVYATIEEIPAGKFKESGTGIATVVVVIDKPKNKESNPTKDSAGSNDAITEGDTVYFQKNTGETQTARAAYKTNKKINLWLLIGPNKEKFEMEERHLSKDPNNVPNRIPEKNYVVLIEHGKSKMYQYVNLNTKTGELIFDTKISDPIRGQSNKPKALPLSDAVKQFKSIDLEIKDAISKFAKQEPELFNKLINLEPPVTNFSSKFDNLTEYSVELRDPETVTFYHGTDKSGKKGIVQSGFDTERYDFYATTDIDSAISFGCDKSQSEKKKKYISSVVKIVPLPSARILNIGNPFVAADLGFGSKNDDPNFIRYALKQADIDDYAKKEGYDAYIYADSKGGGGTEVNYATKIRWIQIINPAQFTIVHFGDFTCYMPLFMSERYKSEREFGDANKKYEDEFERIREKELQKYGYKEPDEFNAIKNGRKKFQELFLGLQETDYNHASYWPKHGYKTIYDAQYDLKEKPILENIEKYYQKKAQFEKPLSPNEDLFRKKMQEAIEEKVKEFPPHLPNTPEIEVLATGRWRSDSFKIGNEQGIQDLQITKLRIKKYDQVVYVRENVQLPDDGFNVSGTIPAAVKILELAVPQRIYQASYVYADIKNIIHNADGHKRIVYANKSFTVDWAEAQLKKPDPFKAVIDMHKQERKQKEAQTKVEVQPEIMYYGKVSNADQKWLEKEGRKSYSGGSLNPIMINSKMVGGIHWDLGGIDYLVLKPEYRSTGTLRKIVFDNKDENGLVKFVTASPELTQKLSNYGSISHDENSDITTVNLLANANIGIEGKMRNLLLLINPNVTLPVKAKKEEIEIPQKMLAEKEFNVKDEIKELKRELQGRNPESLKLEIIGAIKALQDNDTAYLSELSKFGESLRHQTMNRADFKRANALGFDTFQMDKYGWYKAPAWPHIETIDFTAKGHRSLNGNSITIAQGPNGKWTYGINSNTGGAGGGYVPFPSAFPDMIFDTREATIKAATDTLKAELNKYIHSTDRVNHKPVYINAVLKEIDNYLGAGKP